MLLLHLNTSKCIAPMRVYNLKHLNYWPNNEQYQAKRQPVLCVKCVFLVFFVYVCDSEGLCLSASLSIACFPRQWSSHGTVGRSWTSSITNASRACYATALLWWTVWTLRHTKLCWQPVASIFAPSSWSRKMWYI